MCKCTVIVYCWSPPPNPSSISSSAREKVGLFPGTLQGDRLTLMVPAATHTHTHCDVIYSINIMVYIQLTNVLCYPLSSSCHLIQTTPPLSKSPSNLNINYNTDIARRSSKMSVLSKSPPYAPVECHKVPFYQLQSAPMWGAHSHHL